MISDVVVTVPKGQWSDWLDEGDLPGEEAQFVSHFWVSRLPAGLATSLDLMDDVTRVYIVSHGRLRGYSPLWGYEAACTLRPERACLMRREGAFAVTIPETIPGFRGFRYRWWDRADEVPFPEWQTEGVE